MQILRHPSDRNVTASWMRLLLPIFSGLLLAFMFAILLVTLAKVSDVSERLKIKSDQEELYRTRYESEMKELHEIKVKIDYGQATYQQDIRNFLQKEKR